MISRPLAVLMWKHAVVRKRKFISTAIDLGSSLLFLLLLFAFKNEISPEPKSAMTRDESIQKTESIPLVMTRGHPGSSILYSPDTPLIRSFMDEVGANLQWKKRTSFPTIRSKDGYYPYQTSTKQLDTFKEMMKYSDAVIDFHNMEDVTAWPHKLNYTIRMIKDFYTHSYEAMDGAPGAHMMFGVDYLDTFMQIQWAIDSTYIKVHSGVDVNQTISIQEFPYYKSAKNEMIVTVSTLLRLICWFSMLLFFVVFMCRLLSERASGIQELVKMVGVSQNMLAFSHYLNVLPSGLLFAIAGAILLKITSNPLMPNTNGFLLFLMLLLYFNSLVALAFACSYIVKSTEYATTLATLVYFLLWMPVQLLKNYHLPYALMVITGLLPHQPMLWFWAEVAAYEKYGQGVSFSNMFHSSSKQNGSVFFCYICLLLQAAILFALTWYLSLVRPGKYGQALPWNFCVKKRTVDPSGVDNQNIHEMKSTQVSPDNSIATNGSKKEFWSKRKQVEPERDSDVDDLIRREEQYFEEPTSELRVGILIDHISKQYPKHNALNDVSLKVFEGEITVLLGHNGAGKTTLMNIITGMIGATSGKVYVHGLNTATQIDEVRKRIGLCPQNNLYFPDMTLREHIMFYTMLKHGTYSEAIKSSEEVALQLGLSGKLDELCSKLSGGMQRRAQLACALAGNADVLILDEPTAGLDVETRRGLWDLLLSLRGNRTVLLSTHFMEEADVLGDRVAALHGGELRCNATNMYIKKAVGNGYRLAINTLGHPKEAEITTKIAGFVPGATVKEKSPNSLAYCLPVAESGSFPKLFAYLEEHKSELSIESIGVGVTTLEEVFLKLCSDIDSTVGFEDTEDGKNYTVPDTTYTKISGFRLYLRQLVWLFRRQISFIFYRKWVFLILQVILPIFLIFSITGQMNNRIEYKPETSLRLDLDLYKDMNERRVLYNLKLKNSETPFRTIMNAYPEVEFQKVDDVASTVLSIGEKDILEYNKYIAGIELNDTDAKLLYTTTVRHAAPVAMNMLSNLLAMIYLDVPSNQIYTQNYPLEKERPKADLADAKPKAMELAFMWAIFITFFIQSANIHAVSLPCRERVTGSRHIHLMSGCPPELYWIATLLFHMAIVLVFLIVPTVLSACLLEYDFTINQVDFIFVFVLVLVLGSMALYAFMYLVSFNFSERSTSVILVTCIVVFGLVFPFMKTAYDYLAQKDEKGAFFYVLLASSYIMPPHAMIEGVLKTVVIARVNAWCTVDVVTAFCPAYLDLQQVGWDEAANDRCCNGQKPKCYLCSDPLSPRDSIIMLLIQTLVFMVLVFLTERGIFNGIWDHLWNMRYQRDPVLQEDEMVRAERTYVEHEIQRPAKEIQKDALLVNDLHKNYMRLFRKGTNAVKGVNFSVKKGECFGLLGVNGAGKSTTFKMMTLEETPTRGRIFGNGYHVKRGQSEYLQTLGYCPQFFGLDMFLTGYENLSLLLTMRGFSETATRKEVESWIEIVGLQKYAHRPLEAYSGGCMRRLGAAAALCGGAPLALLDEPSAGVDVAARRRLWAALRRGLRRQRAIVITSHSMDEMEALCSRIAIMSAGSVRALGTPAALRAAHAAGHAVVFKVKHDDFGDQVDSDGSKAVINQLKSRVRETFDCNLKDEHKTMLHYHINQSMHYSDLFSSLEALRIQFPNLIEDYSVTETTLEEVFLSIARETQEPGTV